MRRESSTLREEQGGDDISCAALNKSDSTELEISP